MSTTRFLISAGLAAALLAAAYLLLPRAYFAAADDAAATGKALVVRAEPPPVEVDPPAWALGDSVWFVPIVRERARVALGDTLGFAYRSQRRRTRAWLLEAVERGRLDSARFPVPPALAATLREIVAEGSETSASTSPTPAPARTRFVLRGWERELAEADLMGAEDGLRDDLTAWEFASAGGASPEERRARESRVRERRRTVESLRARLAERVPVGTPATQVAPPDDRLSQRDRARILELAEALPADTPIPLRATATGTYAPRYSIAVSVPRGAAIGTLLTPPPLRDAKVRVVTPAYYLVSHSLPALWAVADRVDSLAPRHRGSLVRAVVVE